MATTVSPGMGDQYHQWIKPKPKTNNNEVKKSLIKLQPNMKQADVDVLATMVTKKDLQEFLIRQNTQP